MSRYLVTGGCGFIGSHLVDALIEDGHEVQVLDDLSSGDRSQVHPDADVLIASVVDAAAIRKAIEGVDGCYHLAAIASVPQCNAHLLASHQVNIGGFLSLIEAVRVAKRSIPIVYASSAAVYGDRAEIVAEPVCPAPIGHYGCDKLACELHARAALASIGLASVGLRFFNVYGARQDPKSPYSGVISIFMDRLRRGETLSLHGDGEQTRDFIHVSDVIAAQIAAMARLQRGDEPIAGVFNVCTGDGTTINALAGLLKTISGHKHSSRYQPPRSADIRYSVGCPQAAGRGLDFRAAMSLRGGLADLWHQGKGGSGQAF